MINHTALEFRNDRLDEIRDILRQLSPHEHTDGRNECALCDQPFDEAILIELRKLVAALEDTARLNGLDECNRRLNKACGTVYGWKMVLSHNVTRLMLESPYVLEFAGVDLNDSEPLPAGKLTCREAIDQTLSRVARTNPVSVDNSAIAFRNPT